jgi:response regulator RpfG family c-di-GMP phosphodiesterase
LVTVLILDDDLGFLFWVAKSLEPSGYAVVPADTVSQANQLIRRLKLSVDLLIVNPTMEGAAAFCATLRRRKPGLRIIVLAETGSRPAAGIRADAFHSRPNLNTVTDLEQSPDEEASRLEWTGFVRQVLGKTNVAGSRSQ